MNQTAIKEVRLQLETMKPQFHAALPKQIPVEKFERVVLTAIQTTPELLNVDRRSLFNACMRAAQDGLLPDGRLGALVIYKDKRRGPIAQWLPMVAGIRQKVRNSGEVSTWDVYLVHEKDEFEYVLGDRPHIHHDPFHGTDRGKIVAAYSIAVLKDGGISREVMWIDEIEEIRKLSKAGDTGPWSVPAFYGEMCKKTVAKRHAKVLPMSTDLDDLLRRDDDEGELGAGAGPAIQPRSRNLTDALNMVANLPAGAAPLQGQGGPDQVPAETSSPAEDEFDLTTGEIITADKEAANHGS